MASQSLRSSSSDLGGMNSNENDSPAASRSRMAGARWIRYGGMGQG